MKLNQTQNIVTLLFFIEANQDCQMANHFQNWSAILANHSSIVIFKSDNKSYFPDQADGEYTMYVATVLCSTGIRNVPL